MTAMKSGMKAGRKQKDALEREERKAMGDTRKVLSSTSVLFEVCPEKGKQMPVVKLGGEQQPLSLPLEACQEPFLIKGFDVDDPESDPYKELRSGADKFSEKFKKALSLRASDGRAERLLKGPERELAIKMFHSIFLQSQVLDFAKVHAELQPSAFGIVKGQETVSCEKGRGPTLRLQFQGSLMTI